MTTPTTFTDVVNIFIGLINSLLLIFIALAFIVFVRGLVQFIAKSGDPKSHADGKAFMKWGVIALFVLVSLMGILSFLYGNFGFTKSFGIPILPTSVQK